METGTNTTLSSLSLDLHSLSNIHYHHYHLHPSLRVLLLLMYPLVGSPLLSYSTSLGARGAEMLARRLRGSSCVLMHLALGGNLMGDLGVSLLLSALEACGSCDTLEHLDLSNNSLAMSAGATHPNPSHP